MFTNLLAEHCGSEMDSSFKNSASLTHVLWDMEIVVCLIGVFMCQGLSTLEAELKNDIVT